MSEREAERELVSVVIGYQMRNSRLRKKLSQADLSQGIGSQSMISLIESGRQFPQSDVLVLIAQKLDDPTLLSYAKLLSGSEWSVMDFTSMNHELLVEVLRSHRGRWLAVHLKIASHLCQHFYCQRDFSLVRFLCTLILDHTTNEAGHVKAYYYYGSTYLFTHQYEDALSWLRRADEKQHLIDDSLRGQLQYNLGYAYCELDLYGDAIWHAKLAIDTFHRINDYQRYGKALSLVGVIQARLGRMQEARDTLQRACEMLERFGMSETDRARIAVSLADVCETQQEYATAETWCFSAIESGTASSDFASVCAAYQTLCLIYLAQDESQKASASVRSAMSAADAAQDGRSRFQAYLLASAVLPDEDARVRAAQHAYQCAKDCKHPSEEALAADCLSILLDKQQPHLAQYYRIMAVQLYREQFGGHVMSPSAFRYLPSNTLYDS